MTDYREDYIKYLQTEVDKWRQLATKSAAVLLEADVALTHLRQLVAPGSGAEEICDRLLPSIQEALR